MRTTRTSSIEGSPLLLAILLAACGGDDVCPPGSMPFGERCITADGGSDACVAVGAEVCNGIDDDCNGVVDEGLPTTTYYRDADGDTFGAPATTTEACAMPAGYSATNDDCDDARNLANPGGIEICNALDEDCDGVADNGYMCVADAPVVCATLCGTMGTGVCSAAPRCWFPEPYECAPPAEVCNGRDDDCDGVIDEGSALEWASATDLARPAASRIKIVGNGTYYAALIQTGRTVVVRQLDTTMTPTGTEVVLATLASDGATIALNGSDVVVAWIEDDGLLIVARTAPLATLAFPAGAPFTAGSFGLISSFDVAASGTALLFVVLAGDGLHAVRTSSTLVADTADTLLIPDAGTGVGDGPISVSSGVAGGWAVAYSDRPSTEADWEVFLQGIDASGTALDAPAFRTFNTTNDAFPSLAYDATAGRFAMIWLDGTTARLNTYRLSGTGSGRAMAPDRPSPVDVATSVNVPLRETATPLALDVAGGAVITAYVANSLTSPTVESVRYDIASLTVAGMGRVAATSPGIDSVALVTPVDASGSWPALLPARAIYNRALSTQTLLLACP